MATYQKVLKKLNVQSALDFKNDIEVLSQYYVFASNCLPSDVITTPVDSVNSEIDTFNNLLFGNRIKPTNVQLLALRNNWVLNTVYDIYDPSEPELFNKKFFVLASDGTNYNVYKCLDNNNGSPSTIEPFGTDVEPYKSVVDGYVWKYLYTISDSTFRTFATKDFIPIDEAQNGQNISSLGGIEVITIDPNSRGVGYNNYTIGFFETSESIYFNNVANQYLLNSSASTSDSFYIGCLMKATDLTTGLSQYRKIIDYYIDGSNKVAVLESNFTLNLKAGDTYEIYPNVVVQDLYNTSDGLCLARAIISANSGNSVSSIEVITPGSNYKKVSAYVDAHAAVGVIEAASIFPVISPAEGHGSNLAEELFAYRVCLSTTFNGNTGVLLSDNGYQTVGILKNPLFADVSIRFDPNTLIGTFKLNENIYRYKSYTLNGNVQITSGNTMIISDNSEFGSSLRSSDRVIITNGQQNLLANVLFITDTNTIIIDKTPTFTYSNCTLKVIESTLFGKVNSYTYGDILSLTDVSPNSFDYTTFDLVGDISNTTASINAISSPYMYIGGRSADSFNQFNQLTKLVGTIESNIFINGETISQGNSQSIQSPSATLFAAKNVEGINNDILYVTNTKNTFEIESIINGQTSGGVFTYQYKYDGDLVKNTGDIVYLENLNYITRGSNQSETIKIILEF